MKAKLLVSDTERNAADFAEAESRPGRRMRDSGVAWIGDVPEEWKVEGESKTLSCPARRMRDSGVAWIGAVPEEWKVEKFSAGFRFGKGLNITKADLVDHGVPVISYGQIHSKRNTGVNLRKELLRYVSAETAYSDPQAKLSSGDIVFADTSEDYDGAGNCVRIDTDDEIYAGYHDLVAHAIKPEYSHYLAFLFQTDAWRSQIRSKVGGIKVFSITQRVFKGVTYLLPPLPEQRAIAEYLDAQCAGIDAAVEEAKKGIEEYKAWKKSLVYEVVTGKKKVEGGSKTLSCPARRMRDSGVAWIGEVPEEWRLSRVKNEFANLDYLREPISAENRVNKLALYDYYGASGVIDKIDDYNVDDTVLLIGEDGANLRMRNLPLVYKASGKFWVNNHAHILKVNSNNDYSFMAYALEAGDFNDYITGSAQPKLSQSNLMAYPVAIPPLPEQRAIADYLDEKCGAIDTLVAEKEKLIADLESYKKSLIFECVTGKREAGTAKLLVSAAQQKTTSFASGKDPASGL